MRKFIIRTLHQIGYYAWGDKSKEDEMSGTYK
jgi:hypothetical protein